MKKILLPALALLFLSFFFLSEVRTNVGGAPAARSGGAGEQNCTNSCHNSFSVNSGTGTLSITSDATNNEYAPGVTYTFTVTMSQTGISRFGFECLVGYSTGSSSTVGSLVITNSTETKMLSSGAKRYATHKTAGTTATDSKSWSFDWTAPDPGVGDVNFYVAGNAANNNSNDSGDRIYTSSLTLTQMAVGVEDELGKPWAGVAGSGKKSQELILKNFPSEEILMNVLDANGQTVYSNAFMPAGEETHVNLPLDGIASGIYFITLRGKNFGHDLKFVSL